MCTSTTRNELCAHRVLQSTPSVRIENLLGHSVRAHGFAQSWQSTHDCHTCINRVRTADSGQISMRTLLTPRSSTMRTMNPLELSRAHIRYDWNLLCAHKFKSWNWLCAHQHFPPITSARTVNSLERAVCALGFDWNWFCTHTDFPAEINPLFMRAHSFHRICATRIGLEFDTLLGDPSAHMPFIRWQFFSISFELHVRTMCPSQNPPCVHCVLPGLPYTSDCLTWANNAERYERNLETYKKRVKSPSFARLKYSRATRWVPASSKVAWTMPNIIESGIGMNVLLIPRFHFSTNRKGMSKSSRATS